MNEVTATNTITKAENGSYSGDLFIVQNSIVYGHLELNASTQDALKATANALVENAENPLATGALLQDANGQYSGSIYTVCDGQIGHVRIWAAAAKPLKSLAAAYMQHVSQLPPDIVKAVRLS